MNPSAAAAASALLTSGSGPASRGRAATSHTDTDEVGGSGARATGPADASEEDEEESEDDKLTPLLRKEESSGAGVGKYSKMSRDREGAKDVTERTRLCKFDDDDSMGSKTSVATTASERQAAEENLSKEGRCHASTRQPPPVRRVIPKPFRRQKQSFDLGDGDSLPRTQSEQEREVLGSGDPDPEAPPGGGPDTPRSDRDIAAAVSDPKLFDNGSITKLDSDSAAHVTSDSEGAPSKPRRMGGGGGGGIRDRSKYIYMGDSTDVPRRQASRGESR